MRGDKSLTSPRAGSARENQGAAGRFHSQQLKCPLTPPVWVALTEIGQKVTLSRSRIAEILNDVRKGINSKIDIPDPPQIGDVWLFASCDDAYGISGFPGREPFAGTTTDRLAYCQSLIILPVPLCQFLEATVLKSLGWTQQEIASHPDVTVNTHQAISKIAKNIDTDKICNLFYESHKEVDKIAEPAGWTQGEIGKAKGVGLVQSVVSERLSELPKLVKTIKDSFAKKKPVAEIAEYHNIDETLAWAILLEGKNVLTGVIRFYFSQ